LGICKLCYQEARLIKAHIIPESFYRDSNPPGTGPALIMGTDPGQRTQRSYIGVYDRTILCEPCEGKFAPYDEYAANLLINKRDTAFRQYTESEKSYFKADQYDYSKLKLFIISVLWRASVSSHRFFYRISLDPFFEQTAKDMILAGDPGGREVFSTVLARWTAAPTTTLPSKLMANPYEYDADGRQQARIYLGSFVADVSVDLVPFSMPLIDFALCSGQPLYAFGRELLLSNDLAAFHRTLSRPHNRRRR
jgi:hypothetical protein